jgi:alpha-D-ribose 1-methylphosphonate 5-triphosphate diphosphatase PhnM
MSRVSLHDHQPQWKPYQQHNHFKQKMTQQRQQQAMMKRKIQQLMRMMMQRQQEATLLAAVVVLGLAAQTTPNLSNFRSSIMVVVEEPETSHKRTMRDLCVCIDKSK